MGNDDVRILSIGHSNHEAAHFLKLLREAEIDAIADVRSQPYSQRLPHFSRGDLAAWLEDNGVRYAFFGGMLGGRPKQPSLYDPDGRVNYDRVRRTKFFQEGLDRLIEAGRDQRVAMFCAEENPLSCHRGLMIAPALRECGIDSIHVRGDGTSENMDALEARLLAETKVGIGILDGLFAASVSAEERAHLLAEAYRVQARRKGFRVQAEEETD